MRARRLYFVTLATVAACGGGGDKTPDATTVVDVAPAIDAPDIDAPGVDATPPGQACGHAGTVLALPSTGNANGELDAHSIVGLANACGGSATSSVAGIAYTLHLDAPHVIIAKTTSSIDTVVDVRAMPCTSDTASLGCNDNAPGAGANAAATVSLQAGDYYVVVTGRDTGQLGNFSLNVTQFDGEGATCTDSSTCGPSLVCRVKLGNTMPTCERHVCEDGVDDDGDGKADYPDDPGCVAPEDDDETDDCPSGPNCPACANGIDDDGDGHTDYPSDTSCPSASGASEACSGEQDPIGAIGTGATSGTLVGAHDDHDPTCGGNGGADVLYTMRITATSTLTIDTNGSAVTDTILSLLSATCGEPSIACDDDSGTGNLSLITRTNQPAGVYVVAVDAYSSGTPLAPFTINVHGTIQAGASCEPDVTLNGALMCPTGIPCTGAVGSRICAVAQCADGIDNNGDGKIDYPNDPGCTSPTDSTEDTVCPGAMCPICSDGIDNDGDGFIDYPADFSCSSAAGTNETFCSADQDFGGLITMPTTASTLAGLHNDFDESCQHTNGNDQTFALRLPVPVAALQIDTDDSTIFDTVLSVHDSACTMELYCDDDDGFGTLSQLNLTNTPAGIYAITVDAYGTTNNNGPFHLNVHGTVAAGVACTDALFTSGVLACGTGLTCTAGTCQ